MSTRKILKNSVYYGVIPKLTMLINIVILPIITPYLSTFDYGISGVVSSYTSLIVSIAPLGLNVHLTNSFYDFKKHYNLVWGRVLFLFLLSGIVLGVINTAILYFTLPVDSTPGILLAILGSFQVFFFANSKLAEHLYPLLEKPKPLVFTNLAASVIGIAVSFILIYYFKLGYWGLVASPAISALASFFMFIRPIWVKYDIWPTIERNKQRLIELFKIALPIIPHTLGFVLLSSSARIVMSLYDISYDEIGLYSHGTSMGNYMVFITSALVTAIIPQIQVAYRSGNYKNYRTLYYLCQGVSLVCTFLFCIWMPQVYDVLIRNENLRQSYVIASMMCFANVTNPFYQFASTPAFIGKKTPQLLWMVFIPGALNLFLCVVLIPIFGYKAAIYSTLVAYWSQIAIPFFISYFNKSVSVWLNGKRKIAYLFLLLLVTIILGNLLMNESILLKVIISISFVFVSIQLYYKFRINTII